MITQRKKRHQWIVGSTVASLSAIAFAIPSTLAYPIHNDSETRSLLAQTDNSCREVLAKGSGLNVREEPTVYSTAIGAIEDGRNVTISGPVRNGWVRISAPLQGFVYADFLSACQDVMPPSSCRQISAIGGIYIYQEPSSNSEIVGRVDYTQNVTLVNAGARGWVPISAPFQGYVLADYLTDCQTVDR